jgi:hypothetical protein
LVNTRSMRIFPKGNVLVGNVVVERVIMVEDVLDKVVVVVGVVAKVVVMVDPVDTFVVVVVDDVVVDTREQPKNVNKKITRVVIVAIIDINDLFIFTLANYSTSKVNQLTNLIIRRFKLESHFRFYTELTDYCVIDVYTLLIKQL